MITNTIYQSLNSVPQIQRQFKKIVLKLPHRQRLVDHFNSKLFVDPSELHGFYLYYEKDYDTYIFKWLASCIRQYHRVLDIGANIGIYTSFFARQVNHVDAFEPEKRVVEKLKINLNLNNLNNVRIHEKCISKYSGTVDFISPTLSNQGVGSIASEEEQGHRVTSISLDEFLGGVLEESCLIKMDIEGAELLALQGKAVNEH